MIPSENILQWLVIHVPARWNDSTSAYVYIHVYVFVCARTRLCVMLTASALSVTIAVQSHKPARVAGGEHTVKFNWGSSFL